MPPHPDSAARTHRPRGPSGAARGCEALFHPEIRRVFRMILPHSSLRVDGNREFVNQGALDSCRRREPNNPLPIILRLFPTGRDTSRIPTHVHVKCLWYCTLRRRGQRDQTTWEQIAKLADEFLPQPSILHPWPNQRFDVDLSP